MHKIFTDLYNLALRGEYRVSPEGSQKMNEIFLKAKAALKQLEEENKNDESND